MKFQIIICFIISGVLSQVLAQDEDFYLTIVNSKNETVRQIHVGDQIRIKQFNSKLVRGQVTSIDDFEIIIDTTLVSLKDIEKLSTKKGWVQGLGGVLIAVGNGFMLAGAASERPEIGPDARGISIVIGASTAILGTALVLPNYHQLGKSKWLVVSKSQPLALE